MKLTQIIFSLVFTAHLGAIRADAAGEPATRHSLAEANRVLEEEIKLASRPQIYQLINLSEKIIVVKGRGMELHRLPVMSWHLTGKRRLDAVFHLRARPAAVRPKAAPVADGLPPVIELKDMPQTFDLIFDPGLTMTIAPATGKQPWLWAKSLAKEWWARLTAWIPLSDNRRHATDSHVHLTLSQEAAQSLAWVLTDEMATIISYPIIP